MIKGIGVDAVSIQRMAQSININGFIEGNFTPAEIRNCHGDEAEYYATRFACKEAVYKAISKYISLDWRCIEVLNSPSGSPVVTHTAAYLDAGIHRILISIATESDLAFAYCIAE